MALLSRLARFVAATDDSQEAPQATRAVLAGQGYTLRHIYGIGDRCPDCTARLQREEWGQRFTPTVGLNVCHCGFVSQQFTIA